MTLVTPSSEVQVLIRRLNNEDIKTRDASLQAIKNWLAKQPHLPDTWDETMIMNFLRGCNFSLEKTKKKLDLYFTMRTAVPEILSNRDMKTPEIQEIRNQINISPLPNMTADGKRVVIGRAKENSKSILMDEASAKITLMIGDRRLAEEKFGMTGDVWIVDAYGQSPTHLTRISPALTKKYLICLQQAFPVKIKEIHIINAPYFANVVISWLKPFLKQKIRDRIHIHSDGIKSLHKFVAKDILPEEYGGTAGKLQDIHDAWMNKLEECRPWFQQQENMKADESKRPGKPTNYDELFGIAGSFRQLVID